MSHRGGFLIRKTDSSRFVQRGNIRFRGGIHSRRDVRRLSDEARRQYQTAISTGANINLRRSIDNDEWYLWRVILGAKYDRAFLLSRIQEVLSFTIVPINIQTDPRRNLLFFCKLTKSQLNAAKAAVQGMRDPENRELIVHISAAKEPHPPNLEESYVQEKIKESLKSRYRAEDQHINLSDFSQDEFLKSANLYVPLNRDAVIDFICETLIANLIQLRSIDLSGNGLGKLDAFQNFFNKFNMITKVDLSRNRLRSTDDLKPLLSSAASIEYLDLAENVYLPIRSQAVKSSLGRMFPALKDHVNEDLRKSSATGRQVVPLSQISYFVNPDLKAPLMRFIAEYLTKFDTNRRELLQYYNPSSTVTLHCGTHSLVTAASRRFQSDMFNIYNRNLHQIRDIHRRVSSIQKGDIQIVAFLEKLPATKHHLVDNGTFNVEVPFQSPSFMLLHFNGLYDETPVSKVGPNILRAYSCNMVIIPPFIILNHDLLVVNPTADMIQRSKQTTLDSTAAAPSMPTAMSVGPVPEPSVMNAVAGVTPPAATQQNLVRQLMQASGMVEFFAQKCLQDFDWNFDAALSKFVELRDAGCIPKEAFAT